MYLLLLAPGAPFLERPDKGDEKRRSGSPKDGISFPISVILESFLVAFLFAFSTSCCYQNAYEFMGRPRVTRNELLAAGITAVELRGFVADGSFT